MDYLDEKNMDEAVQTKHGETENKMASFEQIQILNKIRLSLDAKQEELAENTCSYEQYERLVLKDIHDLIALVRQPESSLSEQFSLLDNIRTNL